MVPRDGFCDMLEETQEVVMAVAREACKKHHDGELKYYKTMAIYVKEQLDQKLGNSWHICVGKSDNKKLKINLCSENVSHFELFLSWTSQCDSMFN